jgi:quercetin dioxygenase-like cupin family protein
MDPSTAGSAADILTTPYQRGRQLGRSHWHLGALFTWLARAEDTGGTFSLVDVQARPGSEPPPHTHSNEDEAAFVVSGDLTFRAGDEIMRATAGQFVYLPRGVQHQFTINSAEAHLLYLITPAGLETTFDEFSEPATELAPPEQAPGPPSPELIATIVDRFGAAGVRFAVPTDE